MKIYAPKIFSDLRNHFSISNQFFLDNLNVRKIVQALNKRKFSEGRSGSILIVIPNNPFIIKLISETEALLLISLIKNYYKVCFFIYLFILFYLFIYLFYLFIYFIIYFI